MLKGKLVFTRVIQDSQDYGSDDKHMVSRVFFDLEVGGDVRRGLYADVKQTVGTSYETAPLEVSFPRHYKGPLDYGVFRSHVETYYREGFGSRGQGFRLGPGEKNIRMRNNSYVSTKVVDIEVDDHREPWGW
jgi:hypothetical protein